MVAVSVILPVYNVENYIAQCLESLLSQSLKDFEIICINDGSIDNSLAILNQYKNRDSRIIVKSQNNKGAGAARNLGMQFAKGKYLIFLDADDFFEQEMLEKNVEVLEKDNSDVAVFISRSYDHQTGEFAKRHKSIREKICPAHSPFSPHEIPKHIFNVFQIAPWNKMFRHSFLKENNIQFQEIQRANDVAFVLQALALANRISVIKETFVNYRINTGTSLQQTNDKTPLSFWDAFVEAKRRLVLSGVYEEFEQSFLNCVLGNFFYNLNSVKSEEAQRAIYNTVKRNTEKEFGFLSHPFSYFSFPDLMLEYYAMHADSPIVWERLKEDQDIKRNLMQNEKKKIHNLEKELKKIKASRAFLLGEAFAWPVRRIRKLFR